MPNWCSNRVTISAGTVEEEEQLAKIKAIFEKDNPFQVIYPMPDFDKIPHPETGELPVAEEIKTQQVRSSTFQLVGKMVHRIPDGMTGEFTIGTPNGTSMLKMSNGVMIMRITSASHLIQHGLHPKV